MTTIETFFPIEFPRLPGMRHAVRLATESSVGKTIYMKIDDQELEATIVSIRHAVQNGVNGLAVTTEIED
jgi:hypothetical protein